MLALFDAHCHLQELPPEEVAAALSRARAAGVTGMACCATGEEDWAALLALAEAHPEVVPLVGLHPWKAAAARPGWDLRLAAMLEDHRAGLGECGLDFAHRPVDREAQVEALRVHLRLARQFQRPVVLHCVRAWGALGLVLREARMPPGGIMVHAFNGSPEMARELQALGVLLSFRGPQRALAEVRDDHLLLETDGPEPAALAALVAEAGSDRAARARRNAERFFGGILA